MAGSDNSRKGIALAGNVLVDVIKEIDSFPRIGMLANISSIKTAVGGCVPNTGIDLSVIDSKIPLYAYGKTGNDDYGSFVRNKMADHGIDISGVKVSEEFPTSFTDVFSISSGERTFFHNRGANARFCPDDIDIHNLKCDILHCGYILLLDSFDEYDREYSTVMARFLCNVQKAGIKTSVDVVSDNTADYEKKIVPALKYCNYFIVNEIECCRTFKLEPYTDDGKLDIRNIKAAMRRAAECGVSDKVIVHCKEAGFCLDCDSGEITSVPSLKIPSEIIKGSVGAGDAFCAGCLYGIYNDMCDEDILRFASCAAACSLFSENSIDGMKPAEEIYRIEKDFGRIEYEEN